VAVAATGEMLGSGGGQSRVTLAVYRGVIEHSVYVHPDAQGGGVGGALLAALTGSADAAGFWTIQTDIFPREDRQPPPRSAGWLP
jgi:L-amino acid N-acyltransferase YncA